MLHYDNALVSFVNSALFIEKPFQQMHCCVKE